MDLVGLLLLGELVAKALEMVLYRDVGDMRRHAQALRQFLGLAEPLGLGHRGFRNIAHRDIAALGNELPGELAPHARAATGDDGDLSSKFLHGTSAPPLVGLFLRHWRAAPATRAKCSSAATKRKSRSKRRARLTRGIFRRTDYSVVICCFSAVAPPPQLHGESGSPYLSGFGLVAIFLQSESSNG